LILVISPNIFFHVPMEATADTPEMPSGFHVGIWSSFPAHRDPFFSFILVLGAIQIIRDTLGGIWLNTFSFMLKTVNKIELRVLFDNVFFERNAQIP